MSSPGKLRFITYLAPGIPVEVYENIMYYLEEVTGRKTYLIHESRWSGPPEDREDPFSTDDVDIGFMCCPGMLQMLKANKPVELCPAAPVFEHPLGESRPVYYSDIIVHADNGQRKSFKDFSDLKGYSFAFNHHSSLSGSLIVLGELKKRGYNATFFGNTLYSGAHKNSIKMVLDRKADIAAIDSNTLRYYFKDHPENKDDIKVLTSLGPMPIQPVVFNKRLPADLKKQITEALLDLQNKPEWIIKLHNFNLIKFSPIDLSFYDMEVQLLESVKNLKLSVAYY